ncbi:MAG: phosphoglycerate dehydrogenase [Desulfuromonadales bacterium GWD2_61_12]|nr:MAG: phosphoglycerate dehydrogenase [Desulfuromonadales bacterium GWC2_61_20]OGR32690.1 MAG: phosphoglycerate dehydrogenase [Desulfuromonadales bacterium GWD2_61_12]HAD03487.1 phosphoglycerate dehydrogenase [Desulfuromonas sp.]
MKVLISDTFSPEGLQVFEEAAGITLAYFPGLSPAELLREVADADALVVRGGTLVGADVFAAARRLKVVGRAGIGIENIDLAEANRLGVAVMNTPFGSTTTSAEHTIAMLMALARQIPEASASTKAGRWEKNRFLGVEIAGKTLGVIGAGKIGRLVVERAIGLKLRVVVYDPHLSEEVIRQVGAEPVTFDELLSRADFITMHVPLNAETEKLFNAETLARVKPGCRIINCAIGGLIDEEALAQAVIDGRVAGAAVDVFTKEPPAADNPLLALPQVICTPHLRASTVDAQINVTVQVAHQIVAFLQRGEVSNAVNVPAVSADLLKQLFPYIQLAERLGLFQAQRCSAGLQGVEIEYSGALSDNPTEPLTLALLKGLLTPAVGATVNYVNAPHLARVRGIRVSETRSCASEGFSNMIRLTVTGSDGQHSVSGAVFAENDYRIVRVDDYPVEADPHGHLLVLRNADRPGVVGFIGQTLSEAGVNIAMMNLSRRKIQGKAISLINVDSRIPDAVLETLRANEHILDAIQVEL